MIKITQVSKEDMQALLDAGIIKNTKNGYIDPNRKGEGEFYYHVGYYKTKGSAKKRYIEDWYAKKAKKLTSR